MYKRLSITILAFAFVLFSCAKQESLDSNLSHRRPIDFRASFATRAYYDEITTANLTEFYVTAMKGDEVYFDKVKFIKNPENNYFQSSTYYYWPDDDSELTFYAYSDYLFSHDEGSNPRLKVSQARNIDNIVAKAVGKKSTSGSGLALNFEHITSRIIVKAKNCNPSYVVTIWSMAIANIEADATYYFDDKSLVPFGSRSHEMTTVGNVTLNSEYQEYLHYYNIPQNEVAWDIENDKTNYHNGVFLAIDLDITTSDGVSLFPEYTWISVAMPLDVDWQSGMKYIYELDFSNGAGYFRPNHPTNPGEPVLGKIKFNVNVVPWNENEEAIILPAEPEFHRRELQSKAAVVDYDLSTKGGTEARNTANCYVVNAPGSYKLPLYIGNSIKNGSVNTKSYTTSASLGPNVLNTFLDYKNDPISEVHIPTAYPSSTLSCELISQDRNNLISNVHISDDNNYLCFTVEPQTIDQGNAVVAVRDDDGVIWSWHIWVTDYVLGTDLRRITNHDGVVYDMLPINLGWVYNEDEFDPSTNGYSTYYQLGRKDPFYGNMDVLTKSQSGIGNSIKEPGYFFKTYSNESEWSGSEYYNLWNMMNTRTDINNDTVYKTIYDPCPAGYCLPPSAAFSGFTTSGATDGDLNNLNVAGDYHNGWTVYCDETMTSTITFQATGYRHHYSGILKEKNTHGDYWTAGPRGGNTYYFLKFWSTSSDFAIQATGGFTYPADACAIRPMKEK